LTILSVFWRVVKCGAVHENCSEKIEENFRDFEFSRKKNSIKVSLEFSEQNQMTSNICLLFPIKTHQLYNSLKKNSLFIKIIFLLIFLATLFLATKKLKITFSNKRLENRMVILFFWWKGPNFHYFYRFLKIWIICIMNF
jgi:hypothetical protein